VTDIPTLIRDLREKLAKAGLTRLVADTHHAVDYAGRAHGFLRSEGELVPVGAIVLGAEGVCQAQGRARLGLLADAVNALPTLLDEIERLRAALKQIASGEAFRCQRFAEDDDADYFLRVQRQVQIIARQAIGGDR
jgi:hypothetical protein